MATSGSRMAECSVTSTTSRSGSSPVARTVARDGVVKTAIFGSAATGGRIPAAGPRRGSPAEPDLRAAPSRRDPEATRGVRLAAPPAHLPGPSKQPMSEAFDGTRVLVADDQPDVLAAADTVMSRPNAELIAEVFPGVPVTREVASLGARDLWVPYQLLGAAAARARLPLTLFAQLFDAVTQQQQKTATATLPADRADMRMSRSSMVTPGGRKVSMLISRT